MGLASRAFTRAYKAVLGVCFGALLCAAPSVAFADEVQGNPCVPTAEQMATYEADGSLAERQAYQDSLGNSQADPGLIQQALAREQAENDGAESRAVPTNWKSGMGTVGPAHVVALRVSFPDVGFEEGDTLEALQALLDEGGAASGVDSFPYESLNAFYQRASYGKLSIDGKAFDYVAQHERSYYTQNQDLLFEEALTSLDASVDFSQFDGNGDGFIDGVYLHFAGESTGWGTVWWSSVSRYLGPDIALDGKRLWNKVLLHEPSHRPSAASTIIHETGHVLGLPDYYSYKNINGGSADRSGILTFDIMMDNQGDHNGFSKWLMGWLSDDDVTRIIANEDGITVKRGGEVVQQLPASADGGPISVDQTLAAFDTAAVAEAGGIVVLSNADKGIFSSYYLLQYDQCAGNQSVGYFDDEDAWRELPSGFRLFRVQAELMENGSDFIHTNVYGRVNDQLIELVDPDMGETHLTPSVGVSRSIERPEYGCMLFAGDNVTPESHPSTNFYENISLGFTGLSVEAVSTGEAEGTLRLSYSGALRPDVETFSIEQQPEYAIFGTDTVTFRASSAPLQWAPEDPESQPKLVVDGVPHAALIRSLEGTTITVSYDLNADALKADSTCEMVFPARLFLVGKTSQGEDILSPEIRVPLTPGAVTAIASSGQYDGTENTVGTPAVSDVYEGSDGRLRFFQSKNGSLYLHKVAADDPARLTTVRIEGVPVSTEGNEFPRFQVMPLEGSTVFLEMVTDLGAVGFWLDEATGAIRSSCAIPENLGSLRYVTDGSSVLAMGFVPGSVAPVVAFVPQNDGSTALRYGCVSASDCFSLDAKRMAFVASEGANGGPTVRVVDARTVAELAKKGAETLEEGFAAGDMLAGVPVNTALSVSGYGLVSDVQSIADGFVALVAVPLGDAEGGAAGAERPYNALVRFDARGKELSRTSFESRAATELFTCVRVSSNGALAATRVDRSESNPFPSLETVFFEKDMQLSSRMFTTSRANGAWCGAQWLAIGWNSEADAVGGQGSPLLNDDAIGLSLDGGEQAGAAGQLRVRYDLTVAMDGGLGGGDDPEPGDDPRPGGDPQPGSEPEPDAGDPAPDSKAASFDPRTPKPLSATGDATVPEGVVAAAAVCAAFGAAVSYRKMRGRRAR